MTRPRSLMRAYVDLFEGVPMARTTMVLSPVIWLVGVVAAADWGSKYGVVVAMAAAVLGALIWGGAILLVRLWERQSFRKLKDHLQEIEGQGWMTTYRQATPARRFVIVLIVLLVAVLAIFSAWLGYTDALTP